MPNIEAIVREINRDLVPEFEEKLRAYLVEQDKDWLIEQIVRLTLDAHSLEEMDRRHVQQEESRRRQARVDRVKKLNLDLHRLAQFAQQHQEYSRETLVGKGLLSADAPSRGGALIGGEFRSAEGDGLLQLAKDMLFGLLYGDEHTNVHFQRTQRQLLTLILPRMRSGALDFMKTRTELSARGTWQGDTSADNILLEIEYGETADKKVAEGILSALRLINLLEINEQVLYGRMEPVEHSTLVS